MPYPNEHAARVRDPDSFDPDSFRSKDIKNGIRIILGKLKGEDSMIVQAYRFSVDQFSPEEAKQWLEDNKITYLKFEPAKNELKMGEFMDNIEKKLKHTGILGMKWGRRSSRTSSGTDSSSEDYKTAKKLKSKKINEMSNEELKKVATRLRLEKEYKSLNPSTFTKGAKVVTTIMGSMGTIKGSTEATMGMVKIGKSLFAAAQAAKKAAP